MASHRKTNAPTLLSLSKRQWIRIVAIAAAIVMVVAAGIVSRNFYIGRGRGTTVNEYSATDLAGSSVSRSNNRADLRGADANTSYVTVKINGKSRFVLGDNFTDVKSVLDAGNITLEPEDSVTPALTTKVDESTVISISRADTQAETSETAIAFNTVKKETTSLPQGQQKVQTEGQEGVLPDHQHGHSLRGQGRLVHRLRQVRQESPCRQGDLGRHRFRRRGGREHAR